MHIFKTILNPFRDPFLTIYPRGVGRLFKMRGRQGGRTSERGGGADWDSKLQLSIDFCTKCNFIWGARGGRRPLLPLATPLIYPLSGVNWKAPYRTNLSIFFNRLFHATENITLQFKQNKLTKIARP